MTKIKPIRKTERFEKYNCTGKLRVEVKTDDNEVTEIINLPKKGGCRILLQTLGMLITGMLECNTDINYILEILDNVDPCTAPKDREDFKKGEINKDELGFGGCPKIMALAIRKKIEEISKSQKKE